jgi:outer membrane autotransporter protein
MDCAIMTAVDKIDGLPDKTRTLSQSATVGIDTTFFEGFKAGVAFGGFTSAGKIDDFGSKDRAQAFTGTLYASWSLGEGVFLDAALGYGGARFKSTRYDANATGLLTGSRHGDMVFGSLSASWDQKSGQLKYAPYARFEFSQAWLDKYAEQGDANWALAFDKTTFGSQAAVLGLRSQYDIANGSGTVSPTVRVEYRHAFDGDATQTLSYVSDPAMSYGLAIDGSKRDTLTGAIGLKAQGDGALSGEIEYAAGLSMQGGGFAGQGLRGSIRLGF